MFLNFPKNQRKIWQISAQDLQSGQISNLKALSCNTMIIWVIWCIKDTIWCLYFIIWALFKSWAEICQIFRWFFGKFKNIKKTFWDYLTFRNKYKTQKKRNAFLWTQGQLISECLFDVLNFPKNQRKIWQISAQNLKSGQIIK